MINLKKLINYSKTILIILSFIIILFSSLVYLYSERHKIVDKIKFTIDEIYTSDIEAKEVVNPLTKSLRQIPPDNILDLKINDDAHLKGQWSAPIDWSVLALHSILLPDSSVMTYGTFGILEKDNIDVRENKKLTLTDGRKLQRDVGIHQWKHHDVNSGVDFDIWNVNQGYSDSAHQLFKKPVLMDAFCSVVRVIDSGRVFILGGNKNTLEGMPDTQNSTMIYNVKEKTFEMSKSLNFKRWYGSIVRTADNKLVMMGGMNVDGPVGSPIPEILDLDKIENGWKLLDKAESYEFFGKFENNELSYPRAFLASDGNIVGISYNKIWVMDKSDNYRIKKTGEIPLVTGGISETFEDICF